MVGLTWRGNSYVAIARFVRDLGGKRTRRERSPAEREGATLIVGLSRKGKRDVGLEAWRQEGSVGLRHKKSVPRRRRLRQGTGPISGAITWGPFSIEEEGRQDAGERIGHRLL